MTNYKQISIIIPNLNSPVICQTIDSLLDQTISSPYEIIIVGQDKFMIVVAGEFWESIKKYKQKIHALGLNIFLKIINKIIQDDESAQFFEMLDLFVAPFKGGTQSCVLKAALGFGLPVVLT